MTIFLGDFHLNTFFWTNGPQDQYVLIDMTGAIIFRQGLPGNCLDKSVKNCRYLAGARYRQFWTLLSRHLPGGP